MKPLRAMSLFSLVVLLTAACAGGSPTPQLAAPSAVPTQPALPTQQASEVPPQPSATDVTQLEATSPSVLAAAPPPNAAPAVTRIQFQTGATDAVVSGHLAAGGSARYILAASVGQIMRVSLSPDQGQAALAIWGADGTVLISDHAGSTYWAGSLPRTQDYHVDILAAAGVAVDYTLEVVIPERIRFAAGAISASLKGTLAAGGKHSYVLGAAGGQTMRVKLTYPRGEALLVIWGADGEVLISDHAGAQQWSGPLPRTQDYYVDVKSSGSATVQYSLSVEIPPK